MGLCELDSRAGAVWKSERHLQRGHLDLDQVHSYLQGSHEGTDQATLRPERRQLTTGTDVVCNSYIVNQ